MSAHTSVNQRMWDELAPLHASSRHYDVESFLQHPDSLDDLELGEVGDVAGKRMAHLMCHIGLDTLSWARRGAQVTGVDFSEPALRVARNLSDRIGTEVDLVCADVLAAADRLDGQFDIVFLSKGILMWIEDLAAWARVCARLLEPGGVFYLLDFHPLALALGYADDGLVLQGSYFHTPEPVVVLTDGSYAVPDAGLENRESREWNHSVGEVVTALAEAGIRIEFLHEHPPGEGLSWAAPAADSAADRARHHLPVAYSIRGIRT